LIDPAIARAILVDVADVVVYTTEHCPFCVRAKALLDARGIAYTEINLERDPDGRAELVRKTGMMTFPQVIIDGTLVGGFQETLAADRSGQLAELLNKAA
jgi:glutaredoxin 3